MRPQIYTILVAIIVLVFVLSPLKAQITTTDTFGSGANSFSMDFVGVGNPGNAAQSASNRSHGESGGDGYGAVSYSYRISTYEISQDMITKATARGMSNVTAGPWTGSQPAANLSWYEAAAFVNWLNTSTGKQAAYNLTFSGSWSITLWSSADAWTAGGTNLYRHKDAFYFLPSENEWYKAAYYNPGDSNYFLYPTASDTAPTAVASGTGAGSAVFNGAASVPALVDSAGGLSPYGTMGQGGNVWEWSESAFDGTNDSSSENRAFRGGNWNWPEYAFPSSNRISADPTYVYLDVGFRVASVPEPSTCALLLVAGAGAIWWVRRRRECNGSLEP